MGVSHYWFNCLLSNSEYDQILPFYKKAESEAILSAEAERRINFWKKNQDNIDWFSPDGAQWNDFLCVFDLPGFKELASCLITSEVPFTGILREETVPRFIILNRNTPVSVLWYAMGCEAADKLPGKMGNLLVHSSEVKSTLKKIKDIFNNLNTNELLRKAQSYLVSDVDEEKMLEIITMLPDGLEKALRSKTGIVFLACVQL
jgi:hypothetical protein